VDDVGAAVFDDRLGVGAEFALSLHRPLHRLPLRRAADADGTLVAGAIGDRRHRRSAPSAIGAIGDRRIDLTHDREARSTAPKPRCNARPRSRRRPVDVTTFDTLTDGDSGNVSRVGQCELDRGLSWEYRTGENNTGRPGFRDEQRLRRSGCSHRGRGVGPARASGGRA
jgi:hypothetical protein